MAIGRCKPSGDRQGRWTTDLGRNVRTMDLRIVANALETGWIVISAHSGH